MKNKTAAGQSRRMANVKNEFRRNKQAIFAAGFILTIILICLLVVFVKADPDAIDMGKMLQPASGKHWLGTDELGRDYLLRVIYGGRVSLLVGVLAMFTSVMIGVVIGTAAGYFGGFIDSLLMRMVDIFTAIPWIIMVTVVALLFKKGLASIIIVIGCFSWMEIARLVRAETLSCREREYVQYAKFIGIPSGAIIRHHIIPAVFPTIITAATAAIANAIMTESALSFLNLGVQQPMSSWGSLLQSAQQNLQQAPLMAVVPGVLIILTVYSFNKLGDILRVFVEPRITAGDKYDA